MRPEQSLFVPGRRRKLNAVALCLNIFVPWLLFCAVVFLLTIQLHHRAPTETWILVATITLLPTLALAQLAWATRKSYDPNWYKAALLLIVIASSLGVGLGQYNYLKLLRPFYELEQLQTYPHVDVSKTSGKHIQDAGRVYFASGTKIDGSRSWHFRDETVYCVAPIVGSDPNSTLDFWAVGKDCCSEASPDFRCGEFQNPKARAGIRQLDDVFPERHFYRLAVRGSEAIFGVKAPNPLFFTWTQDPLQEMNAFRDKGWSRLMLAIQASFTLAVMMVALLACCFARLGRSEAKPLLEDP